MVIHVHLSSGLRPRFTVVPSESLPHISEGSVAGDHITREVLPEAETFLDGAAVR